MAAAAIGAGALATFAAVFAPGSRVPSLTGDSASVYRENPSASRQLGSGDHAPGGESDALGGLPIHPGLRYSVGIVKLASLPDLAVSY
jgi:hypothetical protein